ncbi:hypothetical protein H6785_02485 [Candidatus Nomurabacteria bacterium]|nr:hypothetical protein [Candidatus Nomurabacteria bacterium]
MINIFRDLKIGYLDERAHKLVVETTRKIESDSLRVLDGKTAQETEKILGEVSLGFDNLLEMKETHIRLSEKYKHDKKKLLEITQDWYDLNKMIYDLVVKNVDAKNSYFQTRGKEILNRLNELDRS